MDVVVVIVVVVVESSTGQLEGDAVFIVAGVVGVVVVMMGRGAEGGGERQDELVT